MLSFFQKKTYLVDLLEGFVDIHNHILPGIDDGAKTIEDSIALIKGFSVFGVNNFICTPHIMHTYYDNTPETIKTAYLQLQSELANHDFQDAQIAFAAEHMIDDNFGAILGENKVLPLSKQYLLVEMSFLQPPIHLDETLVEIKKKKLFPILAHPERYLFMHNQYGRYQNIKSKGVLFQLNLMSLGDYYGGEIQKFAFRLIEDNLVDFVGSDVHNLSQIETLKEIVLSEKRKNMVQPIIERTTYNFG